MNRAANVLMLLALAASGCRVLPHAPGPGTDGVPLLRVPHAVVAPLIDGRLDDPAWQQAGVIKGLAPCRGGTYQDRIDRIPTTVRVTWDTNCLYVAFECYDEAIDVDAESRHDSDIYRHDACEVFLDGMGDGRQYVEIQASPLGQTLDLMHVLTTEPRYTSSGRLTPAVSTRDWWSFREWDMAGLRVATATITRGETVIGWSTEMAIPAAPVVRRQGRTTYGPGELRANFMRYDWQPKPGTGKRELIHMNWAPVEHGCPHISAGSMGRLVLEP